MIIKNLLDKYYAAKNSWARIRAHNELLRELRLKRTIILVAGHHRASISHGGDTGAIGCGAVEHEECETLVNRAWEILTKDGYKAIVCPFDLTLNQRIKWLNDNFPSDSVLISVHLNGWIESDVSGSEVWYLSGMEKEEKIAKDIVKIISNKMNTKNRGAKGDLTNHHGRLGILRDTNIYNEYLLELGFITNEDDLAKVRVNGAAAVAEAATFAWNYDNQKH